MEDGFTELGTPYDAVQRASSVDQNDDDLISESDDVPDNLQDGLDSHEAYVGKKKSSRYKTISKMARAIINNLALPLSNVLDKWVEEGNKVTRTQVSLTMLYLQKQRMRVKALQLSKWLESSKRLEFLESDYAARIDLIAKAHGLIKAEEYAKQIPESFRSEKVYQGLLVNYVIESNIKKSEEVFHKIKNLGFPLSQFSCNQLLILYHRTDNKKKIYDVLLLMEKENIKPSLSIYKILIDMKVQSNDITGLDQIVERMKAEGVEPDNRIKISLVQHYANHGLKDKVEAILNEMDGDDVKEYRRACRYLLPIYASLGKEDEVTRIWETCEPDAHWRECVAGIEAWGQLKKVKKAEEVFDKMMKLLKQPRVKHFIPLLNVYIDQKMLAKVENLLKQMEESGCDTGPQTWDSLVKLYIGVGDVEKADSILEKASNGKKGMFSSYITILDQYAKRGDINNAEKIFLKMRQVGYEPRVNQYQTLLQAYVKAKVSAYRFNDRMRADNLLPNTFMVKQLAQVNGFKKPVVI